MSDDRGPAVTMSARHVSTKEAAVLLGCSPSALEKVPNNPRHPAFGLTRWKTVTGRWRWDVAAIEAYIAEAHRRVHGRGLGRGLRRAG